MRTFKVTHNITIEALGVDEAETPLLYIQFDDYPDRQTVVVFADEIRHLVAALTEAAAYLVLVPGIL